VSPAGLASSGRTFRHGVHPHEHKHATARLPIVRMPFVDRYVLPLAQHIGAPAKAVVRPGQKVRRGELIAEPGGFVSTAIHAPVTGTVRSIELLPHPNGKRVESIVIETDPFDSQQCMPLIEPGAGNELDRAGRIELVQRAGLVGLGGAAFPTHVKLKLPPNKSVSCVVLNGCECEPYLTCDHRVMVERSAAVRRGLEIILDLVGADHGYIGIELNKPDAVEAMRQAVGGLPIEVVGLTVKYPQGAEKMLIQAILAKEVPAGGLPLDVSIVVQNVGTAAALADLFDRGLPLVERVLTVTGPGIRRPANLLVPLGTPLSAVIEQCGGLTSDARQVILGGPMMGMAQKDLSVPVIKGTSGILALTEPAPTRAELPCIRCGRCLEACPMFLNPSRLVQLARAERAEELQALHVLDCFECASCSYSCPSNIPIVQMIRVGKALVRQKGSS
jgi:Na+-translocating ferredoxin:NAD+ oxidoreductase subunit C